MLDSNDFALPENDAGTEPPAAKPANDSPMIIIEHQKSSLLARLTPPVLILALAMAITSYQRTRVVRPLGPRNASHAAPSKGEPAASPAAAIALTPVAPSDAGGDGPKASAEPAANEGNPVVLAAAAGTRPSPSPFEIDDEQGLKLLAPGPEQPAVDEAFHSGPRPIAVAPEPALPQPDPPVVGADVPAIPDARPEMTKEEILRDIEREAQQHEAERQDLADLKPRANALLIGESIAKIQGKRVPFRNELQEALKNLGATAGTEIDRLCSEYGRDVPEVVRAFYERAKRRFPARITLREEVELMRSFGIPEPVLLDFLAHKLHNTMNTRGGPRDENEVRVRAAQQLLAIPVSALHTVSTPPPLPPARPVGGR
jgi:hypothetical protein